MSETNKNVGDMSETKQIERQQKTNLPQSLQSHESFPVLSSLFTYWCYFVKKNVSTFTTLLPTIVPVLAMTDGNALKESLMACRLTLRFA